MIFTVCATIIVSAVFGASVETTNQLPEWYLKHSDLAETHQIIKKAKIYANNTCHIKTHIIRKPDTFTITSTTPATLSLQQNLADLDTPKLADLYSPCPLDKN